MHYIRRLDFQELPLRHGHSSIVWIQFHVTSKHAVQVKCQCRCRLDGFTFLPKCEAKSRLHAPRSEVDECVAQSTIDSSSTAFYRVLRQYRVYTFTCKWRTVGYRINGNKTSRVGGASRVVSCTVVHGGVRWGVAEDRLQSAIWFSLKRALGTQYSAAILFNVRLLIATG